MSVALDRAYAEMEERARALLQRLAERDKDRHWNEPVVWPSRTPRYGPGDIWATGKHEEDRE